ncbi:MAG TPA: hypothetical protein VFV54_05865, partial [Thermoanaerobaculia bacterium]|nr:hypothetical protein [Thermoanaerobaculia bacterium]
VGFAADGAVVFRAENPAEAAAACASAGKLWRLPAGGAELSAQTETPARRGTTGAPPPRTPPADPE